MKRTRTVPIVLDTVTPPNQLRAGLDEIRRLRGQESSLVEPPQLMPWFWSTARNGVASPEEDDFVQSSKEGFDHGLEQGHAVLEPTLTDGLTAIVTRDATLWPDGLKAAAQASRSLRNLWWLGLADPFIRAYAMSQLGPIAGPIALQAFDNAKHHLTKQSRNERLLRLELIIPTWKGAKWQRRNEKQKR